MSCDVYIIIYNSILNSYKLKNNNLLPYCRIVCYIYTYIIDSDKNSKKKTRLCKLFNNLLFFRFKNSICSDMIISQK